MESVSWLLIKTFGENNMQGSNRTQVKMESAGLLDKMEG